MPRTTRRQVAKPQPKVAKLQSPEESEDSHFSEPENDSNSENSEAENSDSESAPNLNSKKPKKISHTSQFQKSQIYKDFYFPMNLPDLLNKKSNEFYITDEDQKFQDIISGVYPFETNFSPSFLAKPETAYKKFSIYENFDDFYEILMYNYEEAGESSSCSEDNKLSLSKINNFSKAFTSLFYYLKSDKITLKNSTLTEFKMVIFYMFEFSKNIREMSKILHNLKNSMLGVTGMGKHKSLTPRKRGGKKSAKAAADHDFTALNKNFKKCEDILYNFGEIYIEYVEYLQQNLVQGKNLHKGLDNECLVLLSNEMILTLEDSTSPKNMLVLAGKILSYFYVYFDNFKNPLSRKIINSLINTDKLNQTAIFNNYACLFEVWSQFGQNSDIEAENQLSDEENMDPNGSGDSLNTSTSQKTLNFSVFINLLLYEINSHSSKDLTKILFNFSNIATFALVENLSEIEPLLANEVYTVRNDALSIFGNLGLTGGS